MQKESRTLPWLNGVWKEKKRFQTAMSAGAHPAEENQDNFAFYRKKKFRILEWWQIAPEEVPLGGRALLYERRVHHNLAVSQCCTDHFIVWKSNTLSPLHYFQSSVSKGHGTQNANSLPMKAITDNICVLKSNKY